MSLSTRSLVLRKRILSCSGSTAISAFYRKNTSSILCVGSSTSSFGTIATSTDIMSYRSGDCLGKKLSLEEKGSNLSSMRFTTSHGRGGLLKRGLSSGTMNEGENRESLKELIMVSGIYLFFQNYTFLVQTNVFDFCKYFLSSHLGLCCFYFGLYDIDN